MDASFGENVIILIKTRAVEEFTTSILLSDCKSESSQCHIFRRLLKKCDIQLKTITKKKLFYENKLESF